MDIHRAAGPVKVVAPYGVQELVPGEYRAPPLQQQAQQLEFLATTEKPLALGEEYLLSAQPQLPIADTLIQIRRSLPAGASTSYTCGFAALDAAGERSLQAFMTDYTQKNAKLF